MTDSDSEHSYLDVDRQVKLAIWTVSKRHVKWTSLDPFLTPFCSVLMERRGKRRGERRRTKGRMEEFLEIRLVISSALSSLSLNFGGVGE